jgi:hypothetical protein
MPAIVFGGPSAESTRRSDLLLFSGLAHSMPIAPRSRESIYGASIRASAERAKEARKQADRLACEAWNKRMLGFQGPAQPSPPWVMLSTPAIAISRSAVSAATLTRRRRSGIAGFGSLCSRRSSPPAPSASRAADLIGQASVIDGDTLEIHGTRIRLWGTACCWPGEEKRSDFESEEVYSDSYLRF